MAVFYHVDFRGEIREGEVLSTMPVTSSKFPEDAVELNEMFPEGITYFGATMLLHVDYDSIDATIEQILETIRRQFKAKCGVDYPSRMSSLFACADLTSAKHFRANYKRETARIWQVEAEDFFRGDMNYIGKELTDNHNLAVHYWQGKTKAESPFWEYLLRPSIKVLRVVDEA